MTAPPPGWYTDPDGHGQRWWDGSGWTDHRQQPSNPTASGMGTGAKVALWLGLGTLVLIGGCTALVAVVGTQAVQNTPDTGLDDSGGSAPSSGGSASGKTTPQKVRRFSGDGTSNIGTVKVTGPAVLRWTHTGDQYGNAIFSLNDGEYKLNITSQGKSGKSSVEPATYKNIQVTANGSWTIRIEPR